MGMSASQVRLLTLQDRKSTIGLRLGNLATQKRMLNRQMTKLANEYNESFASTRLQWYDTIDNAYTDITYANLMTPCMNNSYSPFLLTDRASGKVVLDGANPVSNAKMSEHMEQILAIGGVSNPSLYVPGSLSLTRDMEFYIIEDMIGVQDFNRYKMRYTPVENVEKSYPQADHVSNITLLENFTSAVGATVANKTTGLMYLNGNGDSYNYFNEITLWKSAYESNAVVKIKPNILGSTIADHTGAFAREFISDLLDYKPIANLESVSNMSQAEKTLFINEVVKDVVDAILIRDEDGNDHVFESGLSNVDTSLNYKVIKDSDGNKQIAYHSDRVNDPIQNLADDPLGKDKAAVAQANATINFVRASNESYDNKNRPQTDPSTSYSYYVSIANLMDVAMYYLSVKLPESTYKGDDIYQYGEDGSVSEMAFYPGQYSNETSMSVYNAGKILVPSMYSVYSNLGMLASKLDNITDPEHQAYFPDAAAWNGTSNNNLINEMRNYFKDIINETITAEGRDLIGIANMNEWLTQAMTTDNPYEFGEFINKAYSAYQLIQTYDLASEEGWSDAQNDSAYNNGFYYDSGVQDFNKRKYEFNQSSKVSFAGSDPDIESQLNADELNKFNFYKKLVKECLARGWVENDNVTDKEYLDAALTNGKWLINDDIAENSRRIFEVSNEDVINEAHSDYEAKLTLITQKEDRIDREMTNLETQQNAINTELEGLKKVIDDNIQSTFNIYT